MILLVDYEGVGVLSLVGVLELLFRSLQLTGCLQGILQIHSYLLKIVASRSETYALNQRMVSVRSLLSISGEAARDMAEDQIRRIF